MKNTQKKVKMENITGLSTKLQYFAPAYCVSIFDRLKDYFSGKKIVFNLTNEVERTLFYSVRLDSTKDIRKYRLPYIGLNIHLSQDDDFYFHQINYPFMPVGKLDDATLNFVEQVNRCIISGLRLHNWELCTSVLRADRCYKTGKSATKTSIERFLMRKTINYTPSEPKPSQNRFIEFLADKCDYYYCSNNIKGEFTKENISCSVSYQYQEDIAEFYKTTFRLLDLIFSLNDTLSQSYAIMIYNGFKDVEAFNLIPETAQIPRDEHEGEKFICLVRLLGLVEINSDGRLKYLWK